VALAWNPAAAAGQGAPFIEAAGEYSPVEIDAANLTWHLGRFSLGWFDEGRSGWTASAERHQRGAGVDWAGVASGFRRAGEWTVSGGIGVTARPEFLYRYSLEGELARRIVGTMVVHGGYRHLAFRDVDARVVQPAVSVYFPRGELQARAFLVRNLTLERSSEAFLFRGAAAVHPRLTLGGGAAVGTRIFDVAALTAADADAWVAFGYARFTIGPAWGLDLGVGGAHEDPFFSQRTVSLALRRTFR
jgi:YaiO family outer membrane protein